MEIVDRLAAVQEQIRLAAERAHRDPQEIRLIPVSKFNPVESIQAVFDAGITAFAENKVQELMEKQPQLPVEIEWHLIGHLQRNKVKYIVRMPNCRWIHAVDSLRLAEEIQRLCVAEDREMNILIQVNVAEDEAKFGASVFETLTLVKAIAVLDRVHVKGLMTIVPEVDDPELSRPHFRRLRELAREIEAENIPGVEMRELSMGMTGDFRVAIEEGATMVRIGSAIFGARDYGAGK